jgi:hypothetical protein
MIERGSTTADEMVLAFLQAEVDSPRYRDYYALALTKIGATRATLIDNADLQDARQNAARSVILGAFRGYGQNRVLFAGFPIDTCWRKVSVTPAELGHFKYAKHRIWSALTRGTRLVADGATNLDTVQTDENTRVHVRAVAERLAQGDRFPPLIAVQNAGAHDTVLMEGHTRATAYALTGIPDEITVLIGSSTDMSVRWSTWW